MGAEGGDGSSSCPQAGRRRAGEGCDSQPSSPCQHGVWPLTCFQQLLQETATLLLTGWHSAVSILAGGVSPSLQPSLLSAGSCVFPVVLSLSPGQNVLGIDFSDCFSSHARHILQAMSLELFCYGDGLLAVQFSATVMLKCYLLHYLWHSSNTIIMNLLKDARW